MTILIEIFWRIAAFMLGSRLRRNITIGGLSLAIVFIYAYAKGRRAERARQAAERLRQVKERIRTDEEVNRMHPDAVRNRLRDYWVRSSS